MDIEGFIRYVKEAMGRLSLRQRATVQRVFLLQADDTGAIRVTQLETDMGAILSNIEQFEQWGITGTPPAGAEGLKFEVGGDPGHILAALLGHRKYRPKGNSPGETVIYDQLGDTIKLDKNRNITITAGANVIVNAATKVTINAPNAEFSGNVKIDGNLAVSKKSTFGSSVTFSAAGKNVTVAATVNLLVITPGTLKIAGTPVVAP